MATLEKIKTSIVFHLPEVRIESQDDLLLVSMTDTVFTVSLVPTTTYPTFQGESVPVANPTVDVVKYTQKCHMSEELSDLLQLLSVRHGITLVPSVSDGLERLILIDGDTKPNDTAYCINVLHHCTGYDNVEALVANSEPSPVDDYPGCDPRIEDAITEEEYLKLTWSVREDYRLWYNAELKKLGGVNATATQQVHELGDTAVSIVIVPQSQVNSYLVSKSNSLNAVTVAKFDDVFNFSKVIREAVGYFAIESMRSDETTASLRIYTYSGEYTVYICHRADYNTDFLNQLKFAAHWIAEREVQTFNVDMSLLTNNIIML